MPFTLPWNMLLFHALTAHAVPDACDGYGDLGWGGSAAEGDVRYDGTSRYDQVGHSLAQLADFDGDGQTDLAFGAPGDAVGGPRAGRVDLMLSDHRYLSVRDVVTLEGPSDYARVGWTVRSAGDLDADGRTDLVISGRGGTGGASDGGRAWVISGRPNMPAVWRLADGADAELAGLEPGDDFGTAMAALGDVNGDGVGDLAFGAPGAGGVGAVYVFYGPVVGLVSPADADQVWWGEEVGDRAGASLAAVDVDLDGVAELVVGAPRNDGAIEAFGAAYVVRVAERTAGG